MNMLIPLLFALAAQEKYPAAIRHYRAALRAKPDYPVALNNLAFALEKQGRPGEARQLYQQVLMLEQGNGTARKRLRLLERRNPSGSDDAGEHGGHHRYLHALLGLDAAGEVALRQVSVVFIAWIWTLTCL